ncbi:MAG TPA: response regulator [Leptospiraceae bacterium]|nr:response regulator [Leptospiraceae bacterium]HMW06944.1 response regulator [Leptospiraceae bacterium]HMX35496.1 response regulator [Leptospiraceae bacterium]HMY30588.1 response regulator [Leptospiraceae bacterium]HMZ66723.1 response regulator [Leptospiraceae bacterium]
MEYKILIIEDEAPARNYLSRTITDLGYKVNTAINGLEGLESFKNDPTQIIITDLNMPVMNGYELIENINSFTDMVLPAILVVTSINDIQNVVDIMRKGAFDYILKPSNSNEPTIKIKNALQIYELNKIKYTIEKEKELRLKEHLDWNRYKENVIEKDFKNFGSNLLQAMRHNFGQAGGLGSLLTLVELIDQTSILEGENYLISKDIIQLVKENAKILEKSLLTINNISHIIENGFPLEKISLQEFYEIVIECVRKMDPFTSLHSNKILLSESKSNFKDFFIMAERERLKEAIFELFKNACKFSEPDSNIYVLFTLTLNTLNFSILNEPDKRLTVRGIPLEYSNLVFEPFFRISKFVEEQFETHDMGLGLSFVKAIIQKHNGLISISNIKDFTAKNLDNIKVNLEINLPLHTEKT